MLFLSFSGILLVATLLVAFFYTQFNEQVKEELRTKAYFIDKALELEDNQVSYLNSLDISEGSVRVTLIADDGEVLYDNHVSVNTLENHRDREEFVEARESGIGESKRYSHTLGEQTNYYAKELTSGNILRVSKTTKSLYGLFINGIPMIICIVVLILIASLMMARSLTKKIIAPINQIDFDNIHDIYSELSPFVRMITKQKKQIKKHITTLEERTETINAITSNMKEGLVLVDNEGNLLSANQSALTLLEVEEYKKGRNILELNRNLEVFNNIQTALGGENSDIIITRNNSVLHIFFSPVSDTGALILMLDITERAQAENRRREFSANVSHELKTPLTTINGYAEMIESGIVKQEDITNFAGKIREDAGRLIHLIEDILMISQLDEVSKKDSFVEIHMDELVNEVIEKLRCKAEKNNIRLISEINNCPVVKGNTHLLFDLLYNIVENGMKYNKENGEVMIQLLEENSRAKIIISDTGIGIPKEHIDRIFERFYRVDVSRSKKTGGTGLGLSIVKHIVNYHNGTIVVDSEEQVGTTFTIVL